MNPTENESLIFNAARQLTDSKERQRYLAEACGDDARLRERVEDLLTAWDAESQFLERPVTGLDATMVHQASSAKESDAVDRILADKYKLIERIGEGGMGSVWRASQFAPVKREVAVKLIKPGMDSKTVLARFDAERQALALMDHPSIAKVLDAGVTADSRPFFVMELVRGTPITEFCDKRKLSPKERLELFVPVCQAIQHAHQKGIIHRDIKPSNVLVALYDDLAVPKVIDFGVAKATGMSLTEQSIHTVFDGVVGTPQYMSPEQATFNNLDIDTRTDVYSLGALLYELLAGAPPFSQHELAEKGVMEILRVVREEEPVKPSTKLRSSATVEALSGSRGMESSRLTNLLRNELDWVVLKALEKDRSRRYETANAFALDIQRYLDGEPVQAHPPGLFYRANKYLRKHRRIAISLAAVLVAMIAGIVGIGYGYFEADSARRSEAKQRQVAESERQKALNRSEQLEAANTEIEIGRQTAERSLAFSQLMLAESAWNGDGTAAQANAYLDAVPAQYRGWEHGFLRRKYQGGYASLYGHSAEVKCLDFSPDDIFIASGSADKTVRLWDVESGICIAVLEKHSGAVSAVTFSPDGSRLISVSEDNEIYLWDVDTQQCIANFKGRIGFDTNVPMASDGSVFAMISLDEQTELRSIATGELIERIESDQDEVIRQVSFESDGKRIYVLSAKVMPESPEWLDENVIYFGGYKPSHGPAGFNTKVKAYDTTRQEVTRVKEFEYACNIATNSVGGQVAISFTDGSAEIWSSDLSDVLSKFRSQRNEVFSRTVCAFSPDGKRLVVSKETAACGLIDLDTESLVDVQDKRSYWHYGVRKIPRNTYFAIDGRRIFMADSNGSLGIADPNSGRLVAELKGHSTAVQSVSFTHDGRRFATAASGDSVVRFWSLDDKNDVLLLDEPLTRNEDMTVDTFFGLSKTSDHAAVMFSGDYLVTMNMNGDRTAKQLGSSEKRILDIAISIDGKYVAVSEEPYEYEDEEGQVRFTDGAGIIIVTRATGEIRKISQLPAKQFYWYSTSSTENLVSLHEDGIARVWNPNTGQNLAELRLEDALVFDVRYDPIHNHLVAAFTTLSEASSGLSGFAIWRSLEDQKPILHFLPADARSIGESRPDHRHDYCNMKVIESKVLYYDADMSRNVRKIVLEGEKLRILPNALQRHVANVGLLAISPDGTRIATSDSSDQTIRIWDAATNTSLLVIDDFDVQTLNFDQLQFSNDGSWLVAAAERWAVRQGLGRAEKRSAHRPVVAFAIACPDASKISGLEHFRAYPTPVQKVVIAEKANRIAATADGKVRVWDQETFEMEAEFRFPEDSLTDIALHPAGQLVATAHTDGLIRLWNVEQGDILATLEKHEGEVDYVRFSPSGDQLISGSYSTGEILSWYARSGAFIDELDERPDWSWDTEQAKDYSVDPKTGDTWFGLKSGVICRASNEDIASELHFRRKMAQPRKTFHRDQARQALDEKDDFAAQFHLKRLEQIVPNSLAAMLHEAGDLDGAIAAYRVMIETAPESIAALNAHINLGVILCDQKKEYEEAAECFRSALVIEPNIADVHRFLAIALNNSGDSQGAITSFRRVTELEPENAENYNRLGDALWNTGDWDGALASYHKALELDPQNAYAHYSAAWMLANKANADGQFPQAEQATTWARRATELEPDNADYQNTLGVALYRTGQWEDACEALLKSIELGNDGPYNWLFLAMANWQLEEKDKAQEWYQKSQAWKADHTEELAEDGELQGRFMEAEQLLQPEKKDQPAESVNSDSTDK